MTLHGCKHCGKEITISRLFCSVPCLRRGYNPDMFPEKSEEAKKRRKLDKIVGRSEKG